MNTYEHLVKAWILVTFDGSMNTCEHLLEEWTHVNICRKNNHMWTFVGSMNMWTFVKRMNTCDHLLKAWRHEHLFGRMNMWMFVESWNMWTSVGSMSSTQLCTWNKGLCLLKFVIPSWYDKIVRFLLMKTLTKLSLYKDSSCDQLHPKSHINPSHAEATFVQSTRMQRILKTI